MSKTHVIVLVVGAVVGFLGGLLAVWIWFAKNWRL